MKQLFIVLCLLIAQLFIGCEGQVEYAGNVYDAATKEPLDSVQCIIVEFKDSKFYSQTDSLGYYEIGTPLVGCVPDCGEYNVEFSKEGYKTQTKLAPKDIYLEKE